MLVEINDKDLSRLKLLNVESHDLIKSKIVTDDNMGKVSDGHHTFDELYEHRHMLYLELTNNPKYDAWKSKTHSDGSAYPGWFLLGAEVDGKPISHHIPLRLWNLSNATELNYGLKWDGHTSLDVINRFMSSLKKDKL